MSAFPPTAQPERPATASPQSHSSVGKANRWQTLWYKAVRRQLAKLRQGELILLSPLGEARFGTPDDLCVQLVIHDADVFERLAAGGSLGAADAFMEGKWECDDLVALVRLLVRNRDLLDAMEGGLARLGSLLLRGWHTLRRNTRKGSRANIAAHYDLGNELFELFLDDDWMMYSSALFQTPEDTLEQAQQQKLHRLCDKLQLTETDHLLEIGTGWGGCALFAARHYGCRVTTITISREQYQYAYAKVRRLGLQDRITVLLRDYRDLEGQYDKLISIEMVEAVGHQFLDRYFQCCRSLLKPGGLAIIQAITIEDHRYRQALHSVDFIKRHIFPGSFIPCVSVLTSSAAKARLRLVNLEDIGSSYALTLNHWHRRFNASLTQAKQLGYDETFIRMWQFYLCYCEGGFRERSISDVHLLFAAERNRSPSWLPMTEGVRHGEAG